MVNFVEGEMYNGSDPICECLLNSEEVEPTELLLEEVTHILEAAEALLCIDPIKLVLA